jgi:hypothetical protein
LKGKVTRNKPAPVTSDYIAIPKELIANHQHITVRMDGIRINGIPFLTTISKNIKYWTAEWIPNQTPEAYRSVLENGFRIYNKAGFRVKTIYCNNEFQPLTKEMADKFEINMNYANPQEHVPDAKRNNRVIKERF